MDCDKERVLFHRSLVLMMRLTSKGAEAGDGLAQAPHSVSVVKNVFDCKSFFYFYFLCHEYSRKAGHGVHGVRKYAAENIFKHFCPIMRGGLFRPFRPESVPRRGRAYNYK